MSEKLLIIPDTHQEIFFIEQILKQEKDFDRIIHLGDWFDSFLEPPRVYGVRAVAQFMNQFKRDYDVTFLVGNHDLAYYETILKSPEGYITNSLLWRCQFGCSGFSGEKARKIKKELTPEFIRDCKLMVYEQGYLISHAGIHPNHIGYEFTQQDIVDELNTVWKDFPYPLQKDMWVFNAGEARGGEGLGGPLWLDWFYEFEDGPYPQICGHTNNPSPRKEGNSYMLDAGQTCYGILQDGILIIKNAYDKQYVACKRY